MRSNDAVKQQMFAHISQWQQSGLTQKAWCAQINLAYHVFHYWYKCYRDEKGAAVNDVSSFVQLQVHNTSSLPAIELQLKDGIRLLFHQPVSSDYLKALIS